MRLIDADELLDWYEFKRKCCRDWYFLAKKRSLREEGRIIISAYDAFYFKIWELIEKYKYSQLQEVDMSEKQEHRRRFNELYEYTIKMEKWLASEPPMIHFLKWHRWKKSRPSRIKHE